MSAVIGHRELAEDALAFTIACLELPADMSPEAAAAVEPWFNAFEDAMVEGYAANRRAVEVASGLPAPIEEAQVEAATRVRVSIWREAFAATSDKLPAAVRDTRAYGDLVSRIYSGNLRRPEKLLAMAGKPYAVFDRDGSIVETGDSFGDD